MTRPRDVTVDGADAETMLFPADEIPAAETKPYRPSNGTEGDIFMSRFCARCERDRAFQERARREAKDARWPQTLSPSALTILASRKNGCATSRASPA